MCLCTPGRKKKEKKRRPDLFPGSNRRGGRTPVSTWGKKKKIFGQKKVGFPGRKPRNFLYIGGRGKGSACSSSLMARRRRLYCFGKKEKEKKRKPRWPPVVGGKYPRKRFANLIAAKRKKGDKARVFPTLCCRTRPRGGKKQGRRNLAPFLRRCQEKKKTAAPLAEHCHDVAEDPEETGNQKRGKKRTFGCTYR